MNSIIWKGVSSTTINGLIISELPPITKPEMRIAETVIDGRDGSIIEELGYSSYQKTVLIGLHGSFDINKVIKYFTGEGDLVFSNEPDKVYKAKICGKIDYTRLLRYRKASITFTVQPFKYKLNEYLRETPTETISGTSIVANNNAEDKLKSFKIYGKSTQNGTPTPDAPVDIISIGEDGTIAVTVNGNAFDLAVVSKLKGIPVTNKNLATYTDANGQMWCADEIDLARGVYVQRITKVVFDANSSGISMTNPAETTQFPATNRRFNFRDTTITNILKQPSDIYTGQQAILSNYGTAASRANATGVWTNDVYDYFEGRLSIDGSIASSVDELKVYLAIKPIAFFVPLAKSIETPLNEEEIALYSGLKLNEPTTITNDENAYMAVEYFKPFEVFNEGLEDSKPLMVLKGSGTVEISVNGVGTFSYTFPEGENEVYIDSEKEDAYLGNVLKNRNMNGEFPILIPKTNKIEWTGDIESISILPRSRWL